MSILRRVRDILASNIYAKVEQSRDPEMEINQFLRELDREVREISAETEAAIANMNRSKRNLDEFHSNIKKLERYAVKALEANDEERARKFLEEKLTIKEQLQEYEKRYEFAAIKVKQIKLAQEKLEQDFAKLTKWRDEMRSRLAIARSKMLVNEIGPSQSNVRLTTFDQLEEQANRALAEAEALEQLQSSLDFNKERISPQYDNSIDNEIAKLKGKIN